MSPRSARLAAEQGLVAMKAHQSRLINDTSIDRAYSTTVRFPVDRRRSRPAKGKLVYFILFYFILFQRQIQIVVVFCRFFVVFVFCLFVCFIFYFFVWFFIHGYIDFIEYLKKGQWYIGGD